MKIGPVIHKKNKSYIQGTEKRKRMTDFTKTIKRPRVQFSTDFKTFEGDRMKSMDQNEIQLENQKIRLLFR